MSVRNVGVPVIVTVACSNVRPATAAVDGSRSLGQLVERGVAHEHGGEHERAGRRG